METIKVNDSISISITNSGIVTITCNHNKIMVSGTLSKEGVNTLRSYITPLPTVFMNCYNAIRQAISLDHIWRPSNEDIVKYPKDSERIFEMRRSFNKVLEQLRNYEILEKMKKEKRKRELFEAAGFGAGRRN